MITCRVVQLQCLTGIRRRGRAPRRTARSWSSVGAARGRGGKSPNLSPPPSPPHFSTIQTQTRTTQAMSNDKLADLGKPCTGSHVLVANLIAQVS